MGPQRIYFKQLQQLINERFDASIGRLQPIKVWEAYRDGDQTVVQKSKDALKGDADQRRGPSQLKPANYFKVGDRVRRINTRWSGKATIRSNSDKQGNRWSLGIYEIHSRRTYANAPPTYELVLVDDGRGGNPPKAPSDFKTRTDYQGIKVSTNRFRHDDLIRVIGDEDAPQDMMENQPPPGDFAVGDRIRVAWKRVRLVGQRRDTQTVAYAHLEQRTDISIVRSGERYYEGTVSYVNSNGPGAPSIRVDFDDGTDGVRVSFLPTSPNYVETDMYEAI